MEARYPDFEEEHTSILLLDENIDFRVYSILLDKGYDVKTILIEKRGTPGEEIIKGRR